MPFQDQKFKKSGIAPLQTHTLGRVSWWRSGQGVRLSIKWSRVQLTQVNSAFHPSGVGNQPSLAGVKAGYVRLCRVASNIV